MACHTLLGEGNPPLASVEWFYWGEIEAAGQVGTGTISVGEKQAILYLKSLHVAQHHVDSF